MESSGRNAHKMGNVCALFNHIALARARTISGLITTQERVERTIKGSPRLKELSMSASLSDGSAKIYQFPAGGRAALGGRSYGEAKASSDENTPRVVCSGSWYHEEAIRESNPTFKTGWDH